MVNMNRIWIEGLPFDEHRAAYPERWTTTHRYWRALGTATVIFPISIAMNWLADSPFSNADAGLIAGWMMHALFVALDPPTDIKTTYRLDKPAPIWRRAIKALKRKGGAQ